MLAVKSGDHCVYNLVCSQMLQICVYFRHSIFGNICREDKLSVTSGNNQMGQDCLQLWRPLKHIHWRIHSSSGWALSVSFCKSGVNKANDIASIWHIFPPNAFAQCSQTIPTKQLTRACTKLETKKKCVFLFLSLLLFGGATNSLHIMDSLITITVERHLKNTLASWNFCPFWRTYIRTYVRIFTSTKEALLQICPPFLSTNTRCHINSAGSVWQNVGSTREVDSTSWWTIRKLPGLTGIKDKVWAPWTYTWLLGKWYRCWTTSLPLCTAPSIVDWITVSPGSLASFCMHFKTNLNHENSHAVGNILLSSFSLAS